MLNAVNTDVDQPPPSRFNCFIPCPLSKPPIQFSKRCLSQFSWLQKESVEGGHAGGWQILHSNLQCSHQCVCPAVHLSLADDDTYSNCRPNQRGRCALIPVWPFLCPLLVNSLPGPSSILLCGYFYSINLNSTQSIHWQRKLPVCTLWEPISQ